MSDTDTTMHVRLSILHDDVGDVKSALKELTLAINRFSIVEERQNNAAQALDRAFKVIEKVEGRLVLQEAISVAVSNALTLHMARIEDVNVSLKAHLAAFKTFEDEQQGIVNKGLGAWKVLTYVLLTVQGIVVWGAMNLRTDFSDIHLAIESLKQADIRIIDRLNANKKKGSDDY
jgi:hypothetical protein